MPNNDDISIQLLSFNSSPSPDEQANSGLENDSLVIEESQGSEDALTPGDLMSFAWQISQGMVR